MVEAAPAEAVSEGIPLEPKRKGLGISLDEAKAVVVEADISPKGIFIDKIASFPITDKQVFWGRIADFDGLIPRFLEIRKTQKLKAKPASINLPMHFCDIKAFDFPKAYAKKSNLEWEIQSNFVGDPQLYRFDSIEAGKSNRGVSELLLAAIAEAVDERATLLSSIGLNAVAVEPDILSLFNGLAATMASFPAPSVLLIDISYPYSSFALVKDNVFIPGGIIKVTDDFLRSVSLDAVPGFAQDLSKAFSRKYELAGFDMGEHKPQMLIVGGLSVDDNVADLMAKELEIPPYRKSPLAEGLVKLRDKKITLSWHSYIKALGLALRN